MVLARERGVHALAMVETTPWTVVLRPYYIPLATPKASILASATHPASGRRKIIRAERNNAKTTAGNASGVRRCTLTACGCPFAVGVVAGTETVVVVGERERRGTACNNKTSFINSLAVQEFPRRLVCGLDNLVGALERPYRGLCATSSLGVIGAPGEVAAAIAPRRSELGQDEWRWQHDGRCRPAASKLDCGVYLLLLRPPS
jgi:hypothetical protein